MALAAAAFSSTPALGARSHKTSRQRTAHPSLKARTHSNSPSGGAGIGGQQAQSHASKHECCQHLGDRVLREGMSGHDVRVLQDYLTIAGYYTAVDGNFGPATRQNVIAFKKAQGFRPNGIVTIPVEKRLRQVVAKIGSAPPPVGTTRINSNGTATAPRNSPRAVLEMVAAANHIINTSYCYAGGHSTWNDSCYDCSGSVSFVLHGANLLDAPEDSTELESYGAPGPGKWVTIYANANHTWIVIAGRSFDTADFGGPNVPDGTGPRWRSNPTGNFGDGQSYVVRHPAGL